MNGKQFCNCDFVIARYPIRCVVGDVGWGQFQELERTVHGFYVSD